MVSNIKNNAEEKQPLLTPDVTSGPQTPTKTILLPLAMFLYTIGRDLGSTATKQFVNNYTKSAHHGDLNSTSLQMFNDSQQSCNINASTSKDTDKKEAADWLLYFELTEYFFGLPVIIMAGIYSDFYGRRIFSLIPVIGASIQWIILFGIVYFEFRVEYIFVAYGICGISGSHYTFNLNMASSIADTTGTGKSRSFHMTILHVYMGIGETLSSLGSGFLIQHMGYGVPCAISSALCLIASVFLYNTPETLTAKLRSEKPQFCETFMRFFGFFFGIGLNKKSDRWIFILTLVAFLFVLSPETQASSLATLYILGAPLCFSSEMLGYYNASSDFLHLVLGAAILKLFHCCMYDEAVVIISLLVSGVSYMVVLAFATYTWMIFLATGLGVLINLPMSLYKSMMSRVTSEKYQGSLFAVIYFFEAICRMASSSLFMTVYGQTQSLMQGFVFLLMAGFHATSALIFIPVAISNINERKRKRPQNIVINVDEADSS